MRGALRLASTAFDDFAWPQRRRYCVESPEGSTYIEGTEGAAMQKETRKMRVVAKGERTIVGLEGSEEVEWR